MANIRIFKKIVVVAEVETIEDIDVFCLPGRTSKGLNGTRQCWIYYGYVKHCSGLW
jgi:hypothetical protein